MLQKLDQLFYDMFPTHFPNAGVYKRKEKQKGSPKQAPWSSGAFLFDCYYEENRIDYSIIRNADTDITQPLAICFTPNGDFRNATSRTKENAKNIYFVAIDFDSGDELWRDFPLKPTWVVSTKRWYHCYRRLKNPVDYQKNQQEFKSLMECFIQDFNADPQAVEINTLMRLPWTHHKKDPMNHVLVQVVEYNDVAYDFSKDLVGPFWKVIVDERFIKEEKLRIRKNIKRYGSVYEDIQQVFVWDVLQKFVSWVDFGKNSSIFAEWRWTWGYKYSKRLNIVKSWSGDKWGLRPTGGPWVVAKHFLWDDKLVFDFFRDNFWISEIHQTTKPIISKDNIVMVEWWVALKKKEPNKEKEENLEEKLDVIGSDNIVKSITKGKIQLKGWGEIEADTEIECGNIIFSFAMEAEEVIASWESQTATVVDWFIKCIGRYINEWEMHYIIMAKKHGEFHSIVTPWIGNKRKLESILAAKWLTFMGNEDIAKKLISIIHGVATKVTFINKLWIYPSWLVINKIWQYTKIHEWAVYYCDIPNYLAEWWGETLAMEWDREEINSPEVFSVTNKWGSVTRDDVMNLVLWLKKIQVQSDIVTLFLLFAMWCFISIFRHKKIKIPWMFISWQPSSGKSTTMDFVAKLLWYNPIVQISINTKYWLDVISSQYVPIKIAEYKAWNDKFDVDKFLKNAYDVAPNIRWKIDWKSWELSVLRSNALLFIDGEMATTDTAVYSRNLSFFADSLKENPKRQEAFMSLIETDIAKKNYLSFFYDNYKKINKMIPLIKRYQKKLEKLTEHYEINEKPRMLYNSSTVMAFAKVFDLEVFHPEIEANLIKQLDLAWDTKKDIVIKNVMSYVLIHSCSVSIEEDVITMHIPVDFSRWSEKQHTEMKANIKEVNRSFKTLSLSQQWTSDMLYIPTDYMQTKKQIHLSFNTVLNRFLWKHPNNIQSTRGWTKRLSDYAKFNDYINNPFFANVHSI